MRSLTEILRDDGGALCAEAADMIDELESDLLTERDRSNAAERDAAALRERVAELEAARLCSACAFGTRPGEAAFCVACGGRR
jgi:hypothetical protein